MYIWETLETVLLVLVPLQHIFSTDNYASDELDEGGGLAGPDYPCIHKYM